MNTWHAHGDELTAPLRVAPTSRVDCWCVLRFPHILGACVFVFFFFSTGSHKHGGCPFGVLFKFSHQKEGTVAHFCEAEGQDQANRGGGLCEAFATGHHLGCGRNLRERGLYPQEPWQANKSSPQRGCPRKKKKFGFLLVSLATTTKKRRSPLVKKSALASRLTTTSGVGTEIQ